MVILPHPSDKCHKQQLNTTLQIQADFGMQNRPIKGRGFYQLKDFCERYVRSVFHTNRQASRVTVICCSCAAVGYIRKLNLRMSLLDGKSFPFQLRTGAFFPWLRLWVPRIVFINMSDFREHIVQKPLLKNSIVWTRYHPTVKTVGFPARNFVISPPGADKAPGFSLHFSKSYAKNPTYFY